MRRDFYPLMMADDSNILDAETMNWRLVVYPLLAAIVVLLGGLIYYYYQQSLREQLAAQANEAILQAKTPEQLVEVAVQFPTTNQATLALLAAASDSFDKKDYAAAMKSYQRAFDTTDENSYLHDSAQVGLASTLDASGKVEDAIHAYLTVAHRGNTSAYAPFAYQAVATIYDQRGDKTNERQVLAELVGLGSDSPFVKEAQEHLKALSSEKAPDTQSADVQTKVSNAINAAISSANANDESPSAPPSTIKVMTGGPGGPTTPPAQKP
jgi:predicted negative regulator of RcsB-dependent stress response